MLRKKLSVYVIYCSEVPEVYVGATSVGVESRWRTHKRNMKNRNSPLYTAMRKYGVKSFKISHVCCCEDIENMYEVEKTIIAQFNSYEKGFNCSIGGKGAGLGGTMSVEARQRQSDATKGRKKSNKTRQNMSRAQKSFVHYNSRGDIHTPEGSFFTLREATQSLGMTKGNIAYRCNSSQERWDGWYFSTPPYQSESLV